MIELRYHIYSLVAVFLALAIGIVIGTSFATNSPLTNTSRRTIERYENDMRSLKTEIEQASDDAKSKEALAKSCQDFCRAMSPAVVKGKLAGRNIAVIRTGDYEELAGSIKQALESAGAKVTSITVMSREFPFDNDTKIAETLTSAGTPVTPDVAARDKLFAILAQSIVRAKFSDLLPKFEKAGIAQFGGDYYRFNKHVVLVGGSNDDKTMIAENIDSRLIDQLQKLGVVVVGCEGFDAAYSYIPSWRKKGIATVDNADTPMGQIALIFALNGENTNFGLKDTADRFIPQSLEIK